MHLTYLIFILLCSVVLSIPIESPNEFQNLNRAIRSPTFKKKPGGLLGGLLGGTGGGHGGGGNYITNINNYGPYHPQQTASYHPHQTTNYGHGHEGGSFAGSAAVAGSTGGHGQAQSQSASFSVGPYSASFFTKPSTK
ncbi:hypothetical protein NQ314_012349 [Rhamnusium bicolor]|uniref:Uncharacterized protein n=1 Tax=Rhamnusium bicolor TaxID=1586634 RepID=A0AAV8XCY3_9CUCU|nr:hypothetical protein NQ314_012349 [Rhamnusium bicolor]